MSRLGQWGREGLPPHSAFCSMQAFSGGRRSAPLGSLRLKCSSRSETHPQTHPGKCLAQELGTLWPSRADT